MVKKKSDGRSEQVSCHTSEAKAKSAVRAKHANEGSAVKITKDQLRNMIREALNERARGNRPHLNKYDPGSLLGHLVYLLDENGLHDEADYLRTTVSPMVADAWQNRER